MILFLSILLHMQSHYYMDGVAFHLKNGTVIKTANSFKEDTYFYSWKEDGVMVTLEKKHVANIQYFSWRVKGKPPEIKNDSSVNRRISGKPVVYKYQNDTYIRVRHIGQNGRSQEGGAPNMVANLKVNGDTFVVNYKTNTPSSKVSYRFYDKQGRIVAVIFDEIPKRVKKTHTSELAKPKGVDVQALGLVEVTSIVQ